MKKSDSVSFKWLVQGHTIHRNTWFELGSQFLGPFYLIRLYSSQNKLKTFSVNNYSLPKPMGGSCELILPFLFYFCSCARHWLIGFSFQWHCNLPVSFPQSPEENPSPLIKHQPYALQLMSLALTNIPVAKILAAPFCRWGHRDIAWLLQIAARNISRDTPSTKPMTQFFDQEWFLLSCLSMQGSFISEEKKENIIEVTQISKSKLFEFNQVGLDSCWLFSHWLLLPDLHYLGSWFLISPPSLLANYPLTRFPSDNLDLLSQCVSWTSFWRKSTQNFFRFPQALSLDKQLVLITHLLCVDHIIRNHNDIKMEMAQNFNFQGLTFYQPILPDELIYSWAVILPQSFEIIYIIFTE